MTDYTENTFTLTGVRDFDIDEVLNCGQCFYFNEIGDKFYEVVAKGKALRIRQEKDTLLFYNTSEEEYQSIWKDYFDLERNYEIIKDSITRADPRLEDIIRKNAGIRILNQDFFETLISFIISQNKQIPQIKQVVRNLSKLYGTKVECLDKGGNHYEQYLFPSLQELMSATDEGIRSCKAGFRAPYILDAVEKVASGSVNEDALKDMSTDEARESLMTIKGVGEKVANCVLLFGLSRREAFPVDVWMKKIMEKMYFHKDTPKNEIEEYAKDLFGPYAGYAQQYLFIYARDSKTI